MKADLTQFFDIDSEDIGCFCAAADDCGGGSVCDGAQSCAQRFRASQGEFQFGFEIGKPKDFRGVSFDEIGGRCESFFDVGGLGGGRGTRDPVSARLSGFLQNAGIGNVGDIGVFAWGAPHVSETAPEAESAEVGAARD